MTIDLTKITTPFGTLPRATQMAMFEARLDGEIVEICTRIRGILWVAVDQPTWLAHAIYRVRHAPVTYDSINWGEVAPQFVAMARSAGSSGILFVNIPTTIADYWVANRGDTVRARAFASYTQGTCDWKDSLVLRPGVAK